MSTAQARSNGEDQEGEGVARSPLSFVATLGGGVGAVPLPPETLKLFDTFVAGGLVALMERISPGLFATFFVLLVLAEQDPDGAVRQSKRELRRLTGHDKTLLAKHLRLLAKGHPGVPQPPEEGDDDDG